MSSTPSRSKRAAASDLPLATSRREIPDDADPLGHRLDREPLGLDVGDFRPRERRRDARVRRRPHRVGACDRPVARVLAEVDEHAAPSATRHVVSRDRLVADAPLDLLGNRPSQTCARPETRSSGRIGVMNVEPVAPERLREGTTGLSSSSTSRTTSAIRRTCGHCPSGRRVEVDQHVVRSLDVLDARVPGVQLDAAEVDHPCERGCVVDHSEHRRVAAWKPDELLVDEGRMLAGRASGERSRLRRRSGSAPCERPADEGGAARSGRRRRSSGRDRPWSVPVEGRRPFPGSRSRRRSGRFASGAKYPRASVARVRRSFVLLVAAVLADRGRGLRRLRHQLLEQRDHHLLLRACRPQARQRQQTHGRHGQSRLPALVRRRREGALEGQRSPLRRGLRERRRVRGGRGSASPSRRWRGSRARSTHHRTGTEGATTSTSSSPSSRPASRQQVVDFQPPYYDVQISPIVVATGKRRRRVPRRWRTRRNLYKLRPPHRHHRRTTSSSTRSGPPRPPWPSTTTNDATVPPSTNRQIDGLRHRSADRGLHHRRASAARPRSPVRCRFESTTARATWAWCSPRATRSSIVR